MMKMGPNDARHVVWALGEEDENGPKQRVWRCLGHY
jgi:hypothetical protein